MDVRIILCLQGSGYRGRPWVKMDGPWGFHFYTSGPSAYTISNVWTVHFYISGPSTFHLQNSWTAHFGTFWPSTFKLLNRPLLIFDSFGLPTFSRKTVHFDPRPFTFGWTVHFKDRPLSPPQTVHYRPDSTKLSGINCIYFDMGSIMDSDCIINVTVSEHIESECLSTDFFQESFQSFIGYFVAEIKIDRMFFEIFFFATIFEFFEAEIAEIWISIFKFLGIVSKSIETHCHKSCSKPWNTIKVGWIPRNFKISVLILKWPILRENHKNDK